MGTKYRVSMDDVAIIKNALSKDECNHIRNIDISIVGKKWGAKWTTQQTYTSSAAWRVPKTPVGRLIVKPYIFDIFKKLNINSISNAELLHYKVGASSPAHIDLDSESFCNKENNKEWDNKKVSWSHTAIITLNSDFTGGELHFPNLNKQFGSESAGDMVIFPSGVDSKLFLHGVNTVTSGERYSLVFRMKDYEITTQ